ncbi:hypothetical protein [Deinococcus sedimenti]|uniref:Porin domain-containing protein n=1 Tax=Deinococcus sedimenti TaxID=1867090 RepID=A0ABQ2S938_9DEIO|nr:hypothetical protein [Deinococcus sedimenti]GGS09970.1 hypothetical protein GCM10008960_40200 [Deinococcus sedimenti]
MPTASVGAAARLALCGVFALAGHAGASGEFHVRFYSVQAPQTFLDAVNVQFRIQSSGGGTAQYGADLLADTRQQSVTARYSSGRNAVQVQARRQVDRARDTTALSGTVSYSYSPTVAPSGVAISSVSTYYAYSGSESPAQSTQVHTGGATMGVRFTDTLTGSVTGSATQVGVRAGTFSSDQRSASLSGALNYRRKSLSVSASPSVSVADGKTRWSVGASAQAALRDDLTLSGTATVTSTSPATASADLQYDASALLGSGTPRGKLSVGAGVSVTPPGYTVSGRVRTTVSPNLSLGGSASVTPATRDVTYAADASGKLGSVYITANTSLTTRPNADPALSVGASVSSQAAPMFGSLSAGYRRQGLNQSAYASGTFGYRGGNLDLTTTLALNATQHAGPASGGLPAAPGPWQLSGSADLTAAYAVQKNFDVSASVRYEPGSSATTPTRLRYGAGLRYRF